MTPRSSRLASLTTPLAPNRARACRSAPRVCLLAALLGGVSAAALGGCESSNTPVRQTLDQRAAAVPMQAEDFGKLGYRVDWRGFATMLPGQKIKSMELLGDSVVVQESAGVLTVMEARNGSTRWSDQVSNPLTKFVGVLRDNDRLIVSSDSEAFFYDIGSGALKARHKLAIVVDHAPIKIGDILVYGSASGQVLGHLTLNGFRQWGAMLGGAIQTAPLNLGDGRAAFVSSGGDVVMLDGVTGLISTRARIALGSEAPLGKSDTLVFIASTDHSLYAIAQSDGTQVWRERSNAPLKHAPVSHNNRVYCDMGEAGLTAFEASSGKTLWANAKLSGTVVGVRNKRLIVWNGSTAFAVDPAKGDIIESVALPNTAIIKTDTFEDGNLYAASSNGVIAKMATK